MSALTYAYHAVDNHGSRCKGTATATSEAEAYRRVAAMGLIPLTIKPVTLGRARKIKLKEIAHFTSQLGVLIGARISISDGLVAIGDQEPDPRLRAVIMDVASRIESGQSLADSMDAHRTVFGSMYIETIRAAEKSGSLVKVLEYLAESLDRSQETAAQVKGALMYPACAIGAMTVGVTFLVGYIVPKFAAMYESRGVELPLITQYLQHLGLSVRNFWWLYLMVIVAAVFGIRAMWKTPAGQQRIDRFLHRIPAIKSVLVGLSVSRFARVFGISLGAGLGLIEAIELAGRASGRPMLIAEVNHMATGIRSGSQLTQVLSACTYLPSFAKRMLSAGQHSGELPQMCTLVAKHFERETSYTTKNLATIIEPILVIGIALIVLIVALAIFLPMWNMVNLVK